MGFFPWRYGKVRKKQRLYDCRCATRRQDNAIGNWTPVWNAYQSPAFKRPLFQWNVKWNQIILIVANDYAFSMIGRTEDRISFINKPLIGGNQSAAGTLKLPIPEKFSKFRSQCIHSVPISDSFWIVMKPSFKMKRLIADNIAVHKTLIYHVAVIKPIYCCHNLRIRTQITG